MSDSGLAGQLEIAKKRDSYVYYTKKHRHGKLEGDNREEYFEAREKERRNTNNDYDLPQDDPDVEELRNKGEWHDDMY